MPCPTRLPPIIPTCLLIILEILRLLIPCVIQRVEDGVLARIVLSLTELGEMGTHDLLNLGEGGIEGFAGICFPTC